MASPSRRSAITASLAGLATLGATTAVATPAQATGQGNGSNRPSGKATVFTVISDIQGDLGDFELALKDIESTNPGSQSAGLVVNGDITPRGYDFEYDAVRKVLDANPHARNVHWSIGNHEFYVPKYSNPSTLAQATWPNGTTEASLFQSFYRFTGRDKVYTEIDLGGVPGLILGTEKYMHFHDSKLWDEVWLSEEQISWLEQRLDFWARRGQPVMVFTHHPFPDTVSGTRNNLYKKDYLQADRLLGILGKYKNVFVFTAHTHWALQLADWEVRRTVPGTGNLQGFQVINTGAIQTLWEDNGAGGERALDGREASGLQVEVYNDCVVVKARDYRRGEWIKEVQIPLFP